MTVREALDKKVVRSEWQAFFMAMAKRLLFEIGVPTDKQRFIEKLSWEKAHYSSQSFDQEVLLDKHGWTEVSGHAYRTDFDLSCHMKSSGVDMRVFKEYEKPLRPSNSSLSLTWRRWDLHSKRKQSELGTFFLMLTQT